MFKKNVLLINNKVVKHANKQLVNSENWCLNYRQKLYIYCSLLDDFIPVARTLKHGTKR